MCAGAAFPAAQRIAAEFNGLLVNETVKRLAYAAIISSRSCFLAVPVFSQPDAPAGRFIRPPLSIALLVVSPLDATESEYYGEA